jgi:kynurenine 3-monooxygenase
MSKPTITVAGAGPIGSMLAIYLADSGFHVEIYEMRPDMRKKNINVGRSINLALAERGIAPLKEVGVFDQVKKLCIPMVGRLIHNLDGTTRLQKYGQKIHEVIHSVSREQLNSLLLDAAEKTGAVNIHFDSTIASIDSDNNMMEVIEKSLVKLNDDQSTRRVHKHTHHFDVLIGADGSRSIVRKTILEQTNQDDRLDWLGHSYKEIVLPSGKRGEFLIDKNVLHIWARNQFMLIALANLEGSFTCTLFMPTDNEIDERCREEDRSLSFANLNSEQEINVFFEKYFPDFYKLVPNITEQFINNPTGTLATVKAYPWHLDSNLAVIGDAAHAIVPFHGQGMNCGFEDCSVFNEILQKYISKTDLLANLDWECLFREVGQSRKMNSDAIADMAIENYMNMRSDVNDPKYLLKKEIAFLLEQKFPQFIPRYSMVMFNRMPYSKALEFGEIQNKLLNELVLDINSIQELDFHMAYKRAEEILPALLLA